MPLSSILLSLFLLLIFFTMTCGLFGSWAWVVHRVRRGEPIFPKLVDTPPVPWGVGSVALVILSWLVVNLSVSLVYMIAVQGFPSRERKPDPEVARKADAPAAEPKGGAGGAKAVAKAKAADRWTPGFTEQMVLVSLMNLVLLVAIPVLLRFTSRARLSDLGFARRHLNQQILMGAVAFFLVSPFVYALNALAVLVWKPESHPVEKMVRNELSMGIAEVAILSAVILAPAAEELIFRGVIQRWLVRLFNPPWQAVEVIVEPPSFASEAPEPQGLLDLAAELPNPSRLDDEPSSPVPRLDPAPSIRIEGLPAGSGWLRIEPIVLTSFLFAAVHFPQWPAPLGIFFLSLGLGYVAQQSGSLIAAMVMHSLFNGLGTLLLFVVVHLAPLAVPPKTEKALPAPSSIVGEPPTGRFATHHESGTVLHVWDQ